MWTVLNACIRKRRRHRHFILQSFSAILKRLFLRFHVGVMLIVHFPFFWRLPVDRLKCYINDKWISLYGNILCAYETLTGRSVLKLGASSSFIVSLSCLEVQLWSLSVVHYGVSFEQYRSLKVMARESVPRSMRPSDDFFPKAERNIG